MAENDSVGTDMYNEQLLGSFEHFLQCSRLRAGGASQVAKSATQKTLLAAVCNGDCQVSWKPKLLHLSS